MMEVGVLVAGLVGCNTPRDSRVGDDAEGQAPADGERDGEVPDGDDGDNERVCSLGEEGDCPHDRPPDAGDGGADAGSLVDDEPGTGQPPEDAGPPAYDVAPPVRPDAGPPPEEGDTGRPVSFGCDPDSLGDYAGDFDGEVRSALGNTDVFGDLRFTIECAGRKLEVRGQMDGTGNVAFPFQVGIEGHLDPRTNRLEAELVDGEVNMILGIVTFEGTIGGTLADDEFADGEWEGASIDPPFVQATGEGTWHAEKQ